MPPPAILDVAQFDYSKLVADHEAIARVNPQAHEFALLDGVLHVDLEAQTFAGFHDVRPDAWWVRVHIPGRPLFPGVLMIELAAQVASFYTKKCLGWKGFVGFGGVNECKFRQQVVPGQRLYILCQRTWERHRRVCCQTQGMVNGNLVFETQIVGTEF